MTCGLYNGTHCINAHVRSRNFSKLTAFKTVLYAVPGSYFLLLPLREDAVVKQQYSPLNTMYFSPLLTFKY